MSFGAMASPAAAQPNLDLDQEGLVNVGVQVGTVDIVVQDLIEIGDVTVGAIVCAQVQVLGGPANLDCSDITAIDRRGRG
jgi:predicted transcriptional regulator